MGYKILDVKADIQEDVIAYMTPLLDREYEFTNDNVDDLCQIVDKHFEKIERWKLTQNTHDHTTFNSLPKD